MLHVVFLSYDGTPPPPFLAEKKSARLDGFPQEEILKAFWRADPQTAGRLSNFLSKKNWKKVFRKVQQLFSRQDLALFALEANRAWQLLRRLHPVAHTRLYRQMFLAGDEEERFFTRVLASRFSLDQQRLHQCGFFGRRVRAEIVIQNKGNKAHIALAEEPELVGPALLAVSDRNLFKLFSLILKKNPFVPIESEAIKTIFLRGKTDEIHALLTHPGLDWVNLAEVLSWLSIDFPWRLLIDWVLENHLYEHALLFLMNRPSMIEFIALPHMLRLLDRSLSVDLRQLAAIWLQKRTGPDRDLLFDHFQFQGIPPDERPVFFEDIKGIETTPYYRAASSATLSSSDATSFSPHEEGGFF
jgi:hypothetical protein